LLSGIQRRVLRHIDNNVSEQPVASLFRAEGSPETSVVIYQTSPCQSHEAIIFTRPLSKPQIWYDPPLSHTVSSGTNIHHNVFPVSDVIFFFWKLHARLRALNGCLITLQVRLCSLPMDIPVLLFGSLFVKGSTTYQIKLFLGKRKLRKTHPICMGLPELM